MYMYKIPMNVMKVCEQPKVTKAERNRLYYYSHKAENHRRQLLSCIRTRGRVPKLYTVLQRKITLKEVSDAWGVYKEKMEGQEIAPSKTYEMKVLIGNMI